MSVSEHRVTGHLDDLKAGVDGYRVAGETCEWTARVHGLYRDGDRGFLQLCDTAYPGVDLLVRVSPQANLRNILAALDQWIPPRELSLTVLTV